MAISPGDWVAGKPGVSNSRGVRHALDRLLATEVILPVWDAVRGQGATAQYRVAAFAAIRLLDYRLGGQSRIRAQFLGLVDCGAVNRAPEVDAGSDRTVTWGEPLELIGTMRDDGLPPSAEISLHLEPGQRAGHGDLRNAHSPGYPSFSSICPASTRSGSRSPIPN
jgi:hypothetical protein